MAGPRIIAVLVGAVTALAVPACSSTSADEATDGYVSGDGSITVLPVEDRPDAPAVSGPSLDGEPIDLADYADQVVVLNTWGSWCADCRAETEDLVAVANHFAGDGVQFVGVNIRDNESAAQAYERKHDVPYPSINDPSSESLLGFTELPPVAIPTTYVIDAEGRIAARVLGSVTESTLRGLVEDVRTDG